MAEATTVGEESQVETSEIPTENQPRRGFWGWVLGRTFAGWVTRLTLLPIIIYLGVFIWGLVWAIANVTAAASFFAYFRSLLLIAMAMTAIAVIIGFAVLITQIARFVNLLRSEVKPITQDTRQAIKNVRTTSEFVQKRAAEPIIRSTSFLAGLMTFLREFSQILRVLRRRNTTGDTSDA